MHCEFRDVYILYGYMACIYGHCADYKGIWAYSIVSFAVYGMKRRLGIIVVLCLQVLINARLLILYIGPFNSTRYYHVRRTRYRSTSKL